MLCHLHDYLSAGLLSIGVSKLDFSDDKQVLSWIVRPITLIAHIFCNFSYIFVPGWPLLCRVKVGISFKFNLTIDLFPVVVFGVFLDSLKIIQIV